MIITTEQKGNDGNHKETRFEKTGVEPVHPGIALRDFTLSAGDMKVQDVAEITGIKIERLEDFINGKIILPLKDMRRLKLVWRHGWRVIRDVQYDYLYFAENGKWPQLSIKADAIDRLFKRHTKVSSIAGPK